MLIQHVSPAVDCGWVIPPPYIPYTLSVSGVAEVCCYFFDKSLSVLSCCSLSL